MARPHWAAAARGGDGEVHVASGPKPVLAPGLTSRVPLLRGPLRLAEAFAVIPIVRAELPQARLPFETPGVVVAMLASGVAGRILRERTEPTAQREVIAAAIGLIPALTALADRDLASYHGVEHKAIGAYEKGSLPPAARQRHHQVAATHQGDRRRLPRCTGTSWTTSAALNSTTFSNSRKRPFHQPLALLGPRLRCGQAVQTTRISRRPPRLALATRP